MYHTLCLLTSPKINSWKYAYLHVIIYYCFYHKIIASVHTCRFFKFFQLCSNIIVIQKNTGIHIFRPVHKYLATHVTKLFLYASHGIYWAKHNKLISSEFHLCISPIFKLFLLKDFYCSYIKPKLLIRCYKWQSLILSYYTPLP